MEVGPQFAFLERDTRTSPLNQFAAKGNEQRLNPPSFDSPQNRIDENFFQRTSLSTVHNCIVSQFSIIRKTYRALFVSLLTSTDRLLTAV
ncbi:MAG TPA: hypothetical protein PL105_04190, partial [Caldilineaceae bacterium]|nr:hypothetical protein [Caldilineaceae bacterium]